MKKLKIWGFRTNKLWKKITASIYYLMCIYFIFKAYITPLNISASLYDNFIYKTSMIFKSMAFLLPTIFASNFTFKNKIPLFKKKKWWTDVLGFIITFFFIFWGSDIITIFHSNDFEQRYKEYNITKVIYQHQEIDEIIEEKSSLNENELENNLENLTLEDNKNTSANKYENIKDSKIKIHYIDVGQGDSIFIKLPNKETMLIDAGEVSKGKTVANYIKTLGYSKIDYLIGTHPHTDHIGGLAYVINSFDIKYIYMPKAISTSKTYENLLNTISQKGLKINTAKSGVNILNIENLNIEIIAPNNENYTELNNYSAVIKITYKDKKFLFMGDAETKSENEITKDVSADVIKVGHHGSDTSSGQSFVNKVKAQYAIITVGDNNKYNHPYQIIIDRWINNGATIYRTDLHGNIIVESDGNTITITTSK